MLAMIGGGPVQAAGGRCTTGESVLGGCHGGAEGRVKGPGVELGADDRRAGRPAKPNSGRAPQASDGSLTIGRELLGGRRIDDFCSPVAGCGWIPDGTNEPAEPADGGVPAITIRDIASFAPTPVADEMEPGPGVAVRRLPANFISRASTHEVTGALLGLPASVRFIPVGFAWDTGDGGRIESATPGEPWSNLHQPELSDTATSHRYSDRGYFEVRPTVTYAAEYRFDGSGWAPIDGTLEVAGEPYRVRVVTVDTRLTRGDCLKYPQDPGCD